MNLKRGDLFLIKRAGSVDPKRQRVFVIVSRQMLLDSTFSTVICAPVYSKGNELSTQVVVGIDEGLKHLSYIHCDELMSISKDRLTNYIGSLAEDKFSKLNFALRMALDIL